MIPVASDGLPARLGRIWTSEKLSYLEKYARAFTTAMRRRWERLIYIDLLAGPGRDIDPDTNDEFNGSPLIALSTKPPFDHLFFGDKDPENISALKARVPETDRRRVTIKRGDCNSLVGPIVRDLSGGTLGLAFVDPEGFEVEFETLRLLAKRRIDVIYLFASEIGLRRNLKNFKSMAQNPLVDRWWGGPDWREIPARSVVKEFMKKIVAAGFPYYDEFAPPIRNGRNAQMYDLLFFAHHELALKLWRGIKKNPPGGQRSFRGIT